MTFNLYDLNESPNQPTKFKDMPSPASCNKRSIAGLCLRLLLPALVATFACNAQAAGGDAGQDATLQLASKIAASSGGDDRATRLDLLTSYETVYGSIDKVPARWPALVRRTLVCQQLSNRICLRSSVDALQKLGGLDAIQLNHLFEVSRYGMSVASVKARLADAADLTSGDVPDGHAVKPEKAAAQLKTAADPAPSRPPARPDVIATAPEEKAAPTLADVPGEASPDAAKEAGQASAKVLDNPANPAVRTATKAAAPRTFTQRAAAKLNRLTQDDQGGFFLNALFVAFALCLILLFLWYSSARSRRAERILRLQALQDIQRLEDQRAEDKIKTDHELWSEQLKSEVAIEAQKAHADNVVRAVQVAADAAMKAEVQRFQAQHEQAQQAFEAEKRRLGEALKAEQAKTEDLVKAAKLRADQAIDAYDQMAARELVFAHKQNDELQDALKLEQQARQALESKVGDALQQVEAFKQREARLQEAINVEQRGRASEARLAGEKLKAAQQAAAALQASLAGARAHNAELERRLAEAGRAAEIGIADADGARDDGGQDQGTGQRNHNY